MAKNNFSAEERNAMHAIRRKLVIHTSLGFAVLAVVAFCLITDRIDLGGHQKISGENLTEIGPRIQYVLQHSTPGVVWLKFCYFLVISRRFNTPAMDPMGGYEYLTLSAKNIFLNSLEQFVMSFTSQLILITYLTPNQVLKMIPVINILFITGRIFFWWGYPSGREFGNCINFFPLFATMVYISYKYFTIFS